jgi:hypothetical protein
MPCSYYGLYQYYVVLLSGHSNIGKGYNGATYNGANFVLLLRYYYYIATKYYFLEDGLFKKSEAARCQSVLPLAEQIIQLQIGIGIIVPSLHPNQFQKPSFHSMDAGKSELSGNYNRTA